MNRKRRQPFGDWSFVIAATILIMGFSFLVRDFLTIHDGLAINQYIRLGRDFVNVWHGGTLALADQSRLIYDLDAYRETLWAALGVKGIYAYSYPPHSLFLAAAFSLLPYGLALAVWTALGLALFTHAAKPYLVASDVPWWWAALLPAGFVNIWAAHYGFLIGALALYGWRWLDTFPKRAGFAFAVMTIKPHMGVLVFLVLALRREVKVMIWATTFSILLGVVASLFFGGHLWILYVTQTLSFQASLIDMSGMAFLSMMPTTTVSMLQLGATRILANVAQAISAIVAITIVIRAIAIRIPIMDIGLLAGTAIFLVLPYAFIYDMPVQSLAALVFAARANGLDAKRQKAILAAAFVLPFFQMTLVQVGLPVAPLILLAALIEQDRIARRQLKAHSGVVAATEQPQP